MLSAIRELAAEPRKFRSVKHAMLWYRDQLAARLRVNRCLSDVGTPRSRKSIDVADATFARLANCLRSGVHQGDPDDEDEAAGARWRVSGELLCWLLAWYEGDGWGDGTWLAGKAGLTRWTFQRRCRRTERAMRARLDAAGLLLEDEC